MAQGVQIGGEGTLHAQDELTIGGKCLQLRDQTLLLERHWWQSCYVGKMDESKGRTSITHDFLIGIICSEQLNAPEAGRRENLLQDSAGNRGQDEHEGEGVVQAGPGGQKGSDRV